MERRALWTAAAALSVAIVSLALNVFLLGRLRNPERLAGPALDRMLASLAREDAKMTYQIRIPAGTPVRFDVPVDERYRVKVNTTLPIDTNVNLPIRTRVGSWNVAVPVKANVPIRTEIPIAIRDTFRLRTATQAELVIPLEIRVRDLPLDALRRAVNP